MFQPRTLEDGTICCSSPSGLCAKCERHFTTLEEDYAPPNPYAAGIAAFRAASATPASTAEDRYKAERLAALAAEYAEWTR